MSIPISDLAVDGNILRTAADTGTGTTSATTTLAGLSLGFLDSFSSGVVVVNFAFARFTLACPVVSSAGGGTFIWVLLSAGRFGLCPGGEAFATNSNFGFALVFLMCAVMAWKADFQRWGRLELIKMATVQ